MSAIVVEDEEHWRELRRRSVGSSEVAALFGVSPWVTHFMLWHEKAGTVPVQRDDTDERMEVGRVLEPAIAKLVALRLERNVKSVRGLYHQHDDVRGMGASVDYVIDDPERGPGLVEIKNVDWFQFADTWRTRPPAMYGLQVQHQFACTGWQWGMIAALVGGNDLKLFEQAPKPRIIKQIEARVGDFWRSIDSHTPPDPTGIQDEAHILGELAPELEKAKLIRLDEPELAQAAQDCIWAASEARTAEAVLRAAQIKLINAMGDAEIALLPGAKAKLSRYRHAAGKVVSKLTVTKAETGVLLKPESVPFVA